MASFYLNTSGTSVSPYSTPETGCTSLSTFMSENLLSNGDTIYVCSDFDFDSISSNWFKHAVTITSVDDTKYNITGIVTCFGTSSETGYSFILENLSLINSSFQTPPPANFDTNPYTKINLDAIILRNLYVKSQNPGFAPPINTTNLIIENCVFDFSFEGVGWPPAVIFSIADYAYGSESFYTRPNSIIIRNNVFYEIASPYYGFIFNNFMEFVDASYGPFERTLTDFQVYNNIIYNGHPDRYEETSRLILDRNSESYLTSIATIENNVIYGKGIFFQYGSSYDPDYLNTIDVSDTNQITNPCLFDVDNGNFNIIPTTPLYNTGYNDLMVGIGMIPIPTSIDESIVVNAGSDVSATADYGAILDTVSVSGTATNATNYAWSWNDWYGFSYATGSSADISVNVGVTEVTLIASDLDGNYNTDSVYTIISPSSAVSATLPDMPYIDSDKILRVRDSVIECSNVNNGEFISLDNIDQLRLEFRNNTMNVPPTYEYMGDDYNIDISATNCEWYWTPPSDSNWQFAYGSSAYNYAYNNKSVGVTQYLLDNKWLMKPFSGITYPPNPGYGVSAYSVESDIYFDGTVTSAYNKDLFGISRRKYKPLI